MSADLQSDTAPAKRTSDISLHWTCDSPSHYNDFLFSALHQVKNIDLLVHYRNKSLSSHPWKTPLRVGYNSRIQHRTFGIDWFIIKKALVDKIAIFVLGGWRDATSVLLIFICILLHGKYVCWTDTPNIRKKRGGLLAAARNLFLRGVFKYSFAILGTGTPALDALSKMGAAKNKLINFPYWVDEKNYSPHSLERSDRDDLFIKFVSSGRVVNSLKGHDIAIRSLAKAISQAPKINFEYLIAGTGPDVEKLRELAEQLGIGKRVKVLGWVEPGELIKIFHESDVLIHPSPMHEPYGVAVIEAMAAGMVVLVSDVTGAGLDRIEHGYNGFIHTAGNADELSEQITWLFEHPENITAIKRSARKTAEAWPVSKGVLIIKKLLQEIY